MDFPSINATFFFPLYNFIGLICCFQEKEIRRFAGTVPNVTTTGDIESMAMYAGQGVGLIKEILPASEVVKRIVEGAQSLILQKFIPEKLSGDPI